MLPKPTVMLACALSAGALALPACGGGGEPAGQAPASQPAPPERVEQLERRVDELEQENERLRRQLKERESDAAGEGDTSPGADSGSGTGAGSTSGAGAGAGAGAGSGGGSGGGGSGSGDAGAGPDPGTAEDDRSVYDICGPNPAPNC